MKTVTVRLSETRLEQLGQIMENRGDCTHGRIFKNRSKAVDYIIREFQFINAALYADESTIKELQEEIKELKAVIKHLR